MSERLSRLRMRRMTEIARATDIPVPLLRRSLRTPAAFREAYAAVVVARSMAAAHALIRERKTPTPTITLEGRLAQAIYQAIDADRNAIEAAEQQAAWALELARQAAKDTPR
jgi:hypothetical protein